VTFTPKRSGAGSAVPVACSLPAGDRRGRLDDWAAVLAHVEGRGALSNGVRLVFGRAVPAEQLIRLTTAEQRCCPFFASAITVDRRGVGLEVTAPDDAPAPGGR
jgi:hypothetical protein